MFSGHVQRASDVSSQHGMNASFLKVLEDNRMRLGFGVRASCSYPQNFDVMS